MTSDLPSSGKKLFVAENLNMSNGAGAKIVELRAETTEGEVTEKKKGGGGKKNRICFFLPHE